MSIDTRRNRAVVHLDFTARCILRGHTSLRGGFMGQLQPADYIPDGINAGDRGLHPSIHLYIAAIHFDADRLQAQAFGVGNAACRHQHQVSFSGSGFVFVRVIDLFAAIGGRNLIHPGRCIYVHCTAPESTCHFCGNLLILGGENSRQHLDDCDFGAEGGEEITEFKTDGSGANHHQGLGNLLEPQYLITGDYPFAISTGNRRACRYGTGGYDDLAGGDRLFVILSLGSHLVRGEQAALPLDKPHSPRLEQQFYSPAQLRDDGVHPFHHRWQIGFRRFDDNAEFGCLLRLLEQLSRVKQSLGGDTAAVQTSAANFSGFDDDYTCS